MAKSSSSKPAALAADSASVAAKFRRRKRSPWPVLIGLLVVAGIGGGIGLWFVTRKTLELTPTVEKSIDEMKPFEWVVAPTVKNIAPDELTFAVENAPAGLSVDKSGKVTWSPSEEQGPGSYSVRVDVGVVGRPDLAASQSLKLNVAEVNQAPELDPVSDIVLRDAGPATVQLKARDPNIPAQELKFGFLKGAPKGVQIDEKTGLFTWAPKNLPAEGGEVTVVVTNAQKKQAKRTFKLSMEMSVRAEATSAAAAAAPKLPSAYEKFAAFLDAEKIAYKLLGRDPLPIFGGGSRVLEIGGERLVTFEFDTDEAMDADVRRVLAESAAKLARTQVYHRERLVVLYQGYDERLLAALRKHLGNPTTPTANKVSTAPASTPSPAPSPTPTPPTAPEPPAAKPEPGALIQAVKELYDKKKLLVPKEYATLRKLFADEFAKSHAETIKVALAADYDEMMAWFDKHKDVKEEFFTAIDPQHDKMADCLGLFNSLRKAFPKQFDNYTSLAIAMAVTWDDPKGVYDYEGHQKRTHSTMPTVLAEVNDNFKYLVDAEAVMQGRIRYMPWEFLTLIVSHRTPIAERQWAVQKYLSHRSMFGSCYSEVPYDYEMLRTSSQVCKLADKEYTLPNILQYGGVCAMQADYAARVGKSLGVPAAYVGGQSQSGDLHAWVMWVELKQVTANSIVFSLESHGRYNLDKYYVGNLIDPQTGQRTTDRELELALQNVGANPIARRHAALVMRAYPRMRDAAELPVDKQLQFLNDVIHYVPGNEAAWMAIAKIAKTGEIKKPQERLMLAALDNLFRTFEKFPDFTWKVFDDLIAFNTDAKQRIAYYLRLVQLYTQGERPDLACEAVLKLSDLQIAEDKKVDAVEGLAATVMKFPEEGRYVPKMLDKLEATCQGFKDSDQHLVRFYQGFLPKVPKTRGADPSKYCMDVYDRSVKLFRRLGRDDLAQQYDAELAKLRASK